jgi:hypothetical protein
VLIFERYLIATAYRPYAVDTPKPCATTTWRLRPEVRRKRPAVLLAICSPLWARSGARQVGSPPLDAALHRLCHWLVASPADLLAWHRHGPHGAAVAGPLTAFAASPLPDRPSHREVLARLHRQGSTPAAVEPSAGREAGRLSRGEGAACWRAKLVTARLAPAAISAPSTVPVAHPIMEATNWLAPGTCPTMAFGFLLFCSPKWVGGVAFANGANRYENSRSKKGEDLCGGWSTPSDRAPGAG